MPQSAPFQTAKVALDLRRTTVRAYRFGEREPPQRSPGRVQPPPRKPTCLSDGSWTVSPERYITLIPSHALAIAVLARKAALYLADAIHFWELLDPLPL